MSPADVGLLLVYGAVVAYFVSRFLRHRVAASLGVALLPSGWIALALGLQTSALEGVKWVGIGAGVALLVLVLQADRGDKQR